jgi:hypothetical protein
VPGLFSRRGELAERLQPDVEIGDRVLDVQGGHGQ